MKRKEFDCVEMKRDIQEALQREYENMDDESAQKLQFEEVMRNPILGPFVKNIRLRNKYADKKG